MTGCAAGGGLGCRYHSVNVNILAQVLSWAHTRAATESEEPVTDRDFLATPKQGTGKKPGKGNPMDSEEPRFRPSEKSDPPSDGLVGGPVTSGWREGTLTRAKELESLCFWMLANQPAGNSQVLAKAVLAHLEAARDAANVVQLKPRKRFRFFRHGSLLERAMSNLDAAEANLLTLAPSEYVFGQIPCLLRHVRSHLPANDPRRLEFERIAQRLGVKDPDHPLLPAKEHVHADLLKVVEEERGKIVSITRSASSAALREQVRVRSFRNILVVTTLAMTLLAIGVAIMGFVNPTLIPMCFAPEEAGEAMVVCPTAQSEQFPTTDAGSSITLTEDIDDHLRDVATPYDLLVVELVGLAAAAIAAAAAIRGMRGSSERYGLPVAIALLKLPTGAVTAFLGVLLMRGEFVPGLSALDTSAQILAWALVFGYAQQLFTRLVDRQGQSVLNSVRSADKPPALPVNAPAT